MQHDSYFVPFEHWLHALLRDAARLGQRKRIEELSPPMLREYYVLGCEPTMDGITQGYRMNHLRVA